MKIELVKDNKVIIHAPYDKELIRKTKAVSVKSWNSQGKYWGVPYNDGLIAKLQDLFGVIDLYFYFILPQEELSKLSIKKHSRKTIKSYTRINQDSLLFAGKEHLYTLNTFTPNSRQLYCPVLSHSLNKQVSGFGLCLCPNLLRFAPQTSDTRRALCAISRM